MPSNEPAQAPTTPTVETETETTSEPSAQAPVLSIVPPPPDFKPTRRYMPAERPGMTRKFNIPYIDENNVASTYELYVTTSTFEDGTLGEVFLKAGKPGEMHRLAMDALGTMISLGLQHGVPVDVIVEKLRFMRGGPSGFIGDTEFKSCTSPFDLLAQYLGKKYGSKPADDAHVSVQGTSP